MYNKHESKRMPQYIHGDNRAPYNNHYNSRTLGEYVKRERNKAPKYNFDPREIMEKSLKKINNIDNLLNPTFVEALSYTIIKYIA